MSREGTTVFARAGKPDFSVVASWISRFAPDMRNEMNRSEEKTLQSLLFYTWYNSHHSGRNTPYCSFSQERVGKVFGRSRWTVARALDRMERKGWIRRIHRRPRPGEQWQTNVYILCGRLFSALAHLFSPKPKNSPCSKTAPQVDTNNYKSVSPPFEGVVDAQEMEGPRVTLSLTELVRKEIARRNPKSSLL